MKRNFYIFATLLLPVFLSCNNEETDLVSHESSSKTVSGVLTPTSPTQTIVMGNHSITLSLENTINNEISKTRVISDNSEPKPKEGETGPFYSKGTPKALSGSDFKNRKFLIQKTMGVPTGIYFGDVWETRNVVVVPSDAYAARVAFPDPSGFKNYTDLSRGVNWNLTTIENDQITITWWFYTFVLNYDAAGRRISEVVPLDGAKIKIPYFYRK